MSPFFLPAGLVIGLVFSSTLIAGTVWPVQVALIRGFRAAMVTSCAIATAQFCLSAPALSLIFNLGQMGRILDPALRITGALWLVRMAFQVRSAPKLRLLRPVSVESSNIKLFSKTLLLAVKMPERAIAYTALGTMMSIHLRSPGFGNALMASAGIALGSMVWLSYFTILAIGFGHRVSESITLKSLNKLRVLAFAVILGYAVIGLTPLFIIL